MTMKRPILLAAAWALFSALAPGWSHADTAPLPKYGVLSLIGDKLGIVSYQSSTGTRLEPTRQQSIAIPNAAFDTTALEAIEAAIKQRPGQREALLFATDTPRLFSDPGSLFSDGRLVLPPALAAGIKADGATHLLVLSRHRQDAKLQAAHAWLGSGRIEGIGYYIDMQQGMVNADNGDPARGFIAPFVSLRLSLVDLADFRLLAQKTLSASQVLSARRTDDSANPWMVMSASEKVDTLKRMIADELARTVPVLLDTP